MLVKKKQFKVNIYTLRHRFTIQFDGSAQVVGYNMN